MRVERASHGQALERDVLIHLEGVNVALNGQRVLHDVSWELRRGENWAVLGPNGAGKSTFLRLLRGEVWPAPADGGVRLYNFDGRPTASPIGVKRRMAILSAEQQQRYLRVHSRKYGDDFHTARITVREIVFTGLLDGELVTRKPTPAEAERVRHILCAVGLDALADVPFDKLSQGQLRRTLIARAVIGQPDVLILDEVGVGLDAHSRRALLDMIQQVAEQGTQVLMTSHRRDELLPAITHVMELKHGRIAAVRRRETAAEHHPLTGSADAWQPLDAAAIARRSQASPRSSPFLVNIANASVALDEGGAVVLRDVTWRMNEGEHWMILGDNGVGKSTLLRLILGELWPAHGGRIERFSRDGQTAPRNGKRDAASNGLRSVWEIKRCIGYVSCEFQARYHADLTAEQVIASGFFASVGWLQPLTRAQKRRVQQVLDQFNLQALAKRNILEMSYGQARQVLVARALVNTPRLLILDEAFDGLDAHFRAGLAAMLEAIARHTGIILVTHHQADVLPCITHRMVIAHGRIESQEQRIRS